MAAAARLRHGQEVPVPTSGFGIPAWVSHAGEPVAMGQVRGGIFRPERVFVLGP